MTLEELEMLPKHTQLKKPDGEIVCFIGLNKAKNRVACCCQENDVIQSHVVYDALEWTLFVDEKAVLAQENQVIKAELGELLTIEATANLLLEENAKLLEENTNLKTELIKLGAPDGAVL